MTPTIAFITIFLLVLPQWYLMMIKPKSKLTQQLVDSDIIPFCLLFIFVHSMTRLEETPINFQSIDDVLIVFSLQNLALGAWAYVGFLSLLVGTWCFNKHQEWTNPSNVSRTPKQTIIVYTSSIASDAFRN